MFPWVSTYSTLTNVYSVDYIWKLYIFLKWNCSSVDTLKVYCHFSDKLKAFIFRTHRCNTSPYTPVSCASYYTCKSLSLLNTVYRCSNAQLCSICMVLFLFRRCMGPFSLCCSAPVLLNASCIMQHIKPFSVELRWHHQDVLPLCLWFIRVVSLVGGSLCASRRWWLCCALPGSCRLSKIVSLCLLSCCFVSASEGVCANLYSPLSRVLRVFMRVYSS